MLQSPHSLDALETRFLVRRNYDLGFRVQGLGFRGALDWGLRCRVVQRFSDVLRLLGLEIQGCRDEPLGLHHLGFRI